MIISGALLFNGVAPLFSPLYGQPSDGERGCSDYIIINGESNVNSFSFNYYNAFSPVVGESCTGSGSDRVEIDVRVKDFNTRNPLMYNDFLDLLRACDYPVITIDFPVEVLNQPFGKYISQVDISLAGKRRSYTMVWDIARCSEGSYLSGSKSLLLSDFDLRSPERLNGLIKVKDEISVSFGFIVNFRVVNQVSSAR